MSTFFDNQMILFPNKIDNFEKELESMDHWAKLLVKQSKIRLFALNDKFFIEKSIDWKAIYNCCITQDTQAQHIDTPWQLIAFSGQIDLLQEYFDTFPELLKATHHSGRSVLHFAAWRGNLECIKFLCAKNQEINANSKCGTPLHYAALAGAYDVMLFLRERGANPEIIHPITGSTILHCAVESGNLEAVKQAISFGVSLTTEDNSGKTAYQLALDLQQENIASYLEHEIKSVIQLSTKNCCIIL